MCGVNRLAGQKGYCGAGKELRAARAALHHWEEPCLSGEQGSGTVFFSHCTLGCVYCQNSTISAGGDGKEISLERLAEIFLELQAQGAHNINLVTGDHYVPHILDALDIAKRNGLAIPIVYNCSGFQNENTIDLMEGYIDIYLPDFKYINEEAAKRYSSAPGYADIAKKAIARMVLQSGAPLMNTDGLLQKGVLVRHLLLPGQLADSKAIIRYLHETYGEDILLSIMSQYTPMGMDGRFPELQRRVAEAEYDELIDYAVSIGVEDAFIQEGESAAESFIPAFDYTGIDRLEKS